MDSQVPPFRRLISATIATRAVALRPWRRFSLSAQSLKVGASTAKPANSGELWSLRISSQPWAMHRSSAAR